MPHKRHGQRFQCNQIVVRLLQVIKRMGKSKFIRGDIFAKKDNAAPVVFKAGIGLVKAHAGSCFARQLEEFT